MQEKQIEKQSPIRICIGQKIDEQIWEMSDTYVFVDWKYDVYKMYAYFTNLFAIEWNVCIVHGCCEFIYEQNYFRHGLYSRQYRKHILNNANFQHPPLLRRQKR